MSGHNQFSDDNKSGYETKDANVAKIIIVGLIAAVILVVCLIFLKQLFIATTEKQLYEAVLKPESATLQNLHERENVILTTYKILNETKGVYQIPIDSAIKIIANENEKPPKQGGGLK